jgi:hypothetical protein
MILLLLAVFLYVQTTTGREIKPTLLLVDESNDSMHTQYDNVVKHYLDTWHIPYEEFDCTLGDTFSSSSDTICENLFRDYAVIWQAQRHLVFDFDTSGGSMGIRTYMQEGICKAVKTHGVGFYNLDNRPDSSVSTLYWNTLGKPIFGNVSDDTISFDDGMRWYSDKYIGGYDYFMGFNYLKLCMGDHPCSTRFLASASRSNVVLRRGSDNTALAIAHSVNGRVFQCLYNTDVWQYVEHGSYNSTTTIPDSGFTGHGAGGTPLFLGPSRWASPIPTIKLGLPPCISIYMADFTSNAVDDTAYCIVANMLGSMRLQHKLQVAISGMSASQISRLDDYATSDYPIIDRLDPYAGSDGSFGYSVLSPHYLGPALTDEIWFDVDLYQQILEINWGAHENALEDTVYDALLCNQVATPYILPHKGMIGDGENDCIRDWWVGFFDTLVVTRASHVNPADVTEVFANTANALPFPAMYTYVDGADSLLICGRWHNWQINQGDVFKNAKSPVSRWKYEYGDGSDFDSVAVAIASAAMAIKMSETDNGFSFISEHWEDIQDIQGGNALKLVNGYIKRLIDEYPRKVYQIPPDTQLRMLWWMFDSVSVVNAYGDYDYVRFAVKNESSINCPYDIWVRVDFRDGFSPYGMNHTYVKIDSGFTDSVVVRFNLREDLCDEPRQFWTRKTIY